MTVKTRTARHRSILALGAVAAIGLPLLVTLAASRARDPRLSLASILLATLGAAAVAVLLPRLSARQSSYVWALVVGTVALLGVVVGGAFLLGNWDYLSGRAATSAGRYEVAVEHYARALRQMQQPGLQLTGPPTVLRVGRGGIVRDASVDVYSDLAYISWQGHDLPTARQWCILALRTARTQGYPERTIRGLESDLRRIDDAEP